MESAASGAAPGADCPVVFLWCVLITESPRTRALRLVRWVVSSGMGAQPHSSLAQFERSLIQERTKAGFVAASNNAVRRFSSQEIVPGWKIGSAFPALSGTLFPPSLIQFVAHAKIIGENPHLGSQYPRDDGCLDEVNRTM